VRQVLVATLLLCAVVGLAADDIVKRSLKAISGHTYVLYVPPSPRPGETFPLVITLHGSGRDGRSLVEKWRPLAKQERFVLAGPDALNREGWQFPADGPDALYFRRRGGEEKGPDHQRPLYIFGHSAGAVFGLSMGLLESEYLAAVSIHAGALDDKNADALMRGATRRIPFQIQIGTEDALFPLARVRTSRDRLEAAGFPVAFNELAGHSHWYYDRAASINKDAWAFLSAHRLSHDPNYAVYGMR